MIRSGGHASATLEIGILVFREGLECILVLAAVAAGLKRVDRKHEQLVFAGAGIAFAATIMTWIIAVQILDDVSRRMSALAVQAATGLLAVFVLVVVMNWFFHKLYWTEWISLHNQRKRELLDKERNAGGLSLRVGWGMALLGFTSFYREGFEVVLFLQSYRFRLGNSIVFHGVVLGVLGAGIVAVFTFVIHRHLSYRRMLVATGVLLGGVLLVMVGEEAQEMQLARWLPTTEIPRLLGTIPPWMALWLSVFPTVETLSAQALACLLVVGSYLLAQMPKAKMERAEREVG